MSSGLYIRSRRTVFPDGVVKPATLIIKGENIDSIEPFDFQDVKQGEFRELNLGDLVLAPALIDTHVHINEPGRTEWEGFETATRAAAAGGISTVIDMPLNSIPATTTIEALEKKQKSAQGHCAIDYGFWGGVVPGNAVQLAAMVDKGVFGFKAFLVDSGVEEFPMSSEADLRVAMPILAKKNVPLLVHAEVECSSPEIKETDSKKYQSYLESRPAKWEVEAIRMMIRLSKETGCHVHIVHLSAADALADIRQAREAGVRITCETCPHYLFFDAESIQAGATQYKCAPPIRESENRERLWQGLKEGTIDFVVSDHSPCTPQLKKLEQGDFAQAWGGISGLQFGHSVVWTAMRSRGFPMEWMSELMSARTGNFLRIQTGIKKGLPANLMVWNPEESFQIDIEKIRHKHRLTPYINKTLYGVVEKTFVRGSLVFDRTGEGIGRKNSSGISISQNIGCNIIRGDSSCTTQVPS